jgi:uncharacterized membrane protein
LPSIAFFTPGKNFWVMFATLLLPVLAWLVARWREDGGASRLRQGGLFALAVVGGLWLLSYLYGFLISNLGAIGGALQRTPALVALGDRAIQAYNAFLSTQGVPTGQAGFLLLGSVGNRLSSPGTWLTLVIFLVLTWGLLTAFRRGGISRAQVRYEEQVLGSQTAAEDFRASGFVLLLILLGLGLALFPEFFYLRDFFGARMNTIFKFYYQAWILLALAAAYGSAVLLRSLRGAGGGLFRLGWVILILAGLVFPVTMLPRKTSDFRPVAWTLDGSLHLRRANPDVGAAIDWLKQAPVGVLAEGVTLSYDYGRLRYSIFSGQPAVIGWPFHEQQWGRTTEIGTREDDMRRLYTTRNWEEARQILQRYEVRYVIVGPNEFSLYNRADMGLSLQVEKFDTFLTPVFQSPSVTIYEVPLAALE